MEIKRLVYIGPATEKVVSGIGVFPQGVAVEVSPYEAKKILRYWPQLFAAVFFPDELVQQAPIEIVDAIEEIPVEIVEVTDCPAIVVGPVLDPIDEEAPKRGRKKKDGD